MCGGEVCVCVCVCVGGGVCGGRVSCVCGEERFVCVCFAITYLQCYPNNI